jgi:cytoskeletal protein RodZ
VSNQVQEPPRLPLRSFAMMLLSAAVVFFAVGWYTIKDGSGGPDPAAQSSSITSTTRPPVSEAVAEPTAEATTETTTAAPTTTTTSELPPPPAPTPAIYVLNNSMVPGLAGQTAATLRSAGWPVAGTGNYSAGTLGSTTVFYSDAPGELELAERVAANLGASLSPRTAGVGDGMAGVVVVVTQDQVG